MSAEISSSAKAPVIAQPRHTELLTEHSRCVNQQHAQPIKAMAISVSFYALLALILWLPIPLGSNRPWAWSIMQVASFAILATLVMALEPRQIIQSLRRYAPLVVALFLFVVYQLIQIMPLPLELVSQLSVNSALLHKQALSVQGLTLTEMPWVTLALDPTQAGIAALKSMSYLAITLSVLLLVNSFRRLKLLMFALIVAGTWQGFYGAISALSGQSTSFFLELANSTNTNNGSANGSFVYRNHYANFLMLCLAIGLGYLVATLHANKQAASSAKDHARRWLSTLISGKAALRIALAIMVVGIVLSRSRMGNSAFFIALTITGVLALLLMHKKSKSLAVLLASVLLIDSFILGSYFGIDKVKTRIEQTRIEQEVRVDVNQYSWQLVKLFPTVGVGGGGYYSAFGLVQGDNIHAFFDHAHNDYLQFAVEYGLVATMWLGSIVLVSLYYALMAMRRRRAPLLQGLGFACCLAIIGMLIHCTVDFNLQAPANAAYFHIVLALAWIAHVGLPSKSGGNSSKTRLTVKR
ncbi:O-antigen ligase family protein [Thalassotalea ponticola]|uniref:O-antigen ligase family protein n=1 Tax=Thalassotalea ponticola TaxID=1523392 RepID=UPI0025B62233|nr:O-antigen ligase family protein [Thalassotalea ponticola]MDN3652631.1 O-antigen ligase family protein [Thalassotalea ponticola]